MNKKTVSAERLRAFVRMEEDMFDFIERKGTVDIEDVVLTWDDMKALVRNARENELTLWEKWGLVFAPYDYRIQWHETTDEDLFFRNWKNDDFDPLSADPDDMGNCWIDCEDPRPHIRYGTVQMDNVIRTIADYSRIRRYDRDIRCDWDELERYADSEGKSPDGIWKCTDITKLHAMKDAKSFIRKEDWPIAAGMLDEICERTGMPVALILRAYLSLSGNSFLPKDLEKAKSSFIEAIDCGMCHPERHAYELGRIFHEEEDWDNALRYLTLASSLGNPKAKSLIGDMLRFGKGIPVSVEGGISMLEDAMHLSYLDFIGEKHDASSFPETALLMAELQTVNWGDPARELVISLAGLYAAEKRKCLETPSERETRYELRKRVESRMEYGKYDFPDDVRPDMAGLVDLSLAVLPHHERRRSAFVEKNRGDFCITVSHGMKNGIFINPLTGMVASSPRLKYRFLEVSGWESLRGVASFDFDDILWSKDERGSIHVKFFLDSAVTASVTCRECYALRPDDALRLYPHIGA